MSQGHSTLRRLAVPCALAGLCIVYAAGIPAIRSQFDEGLVGPQCLPILLVITALFTTAFIGWKTITRPATESEGSVQATQPSWKPFLLFAVILGYIALFKPAGFAIATTFLTYSILWLFDYSKASLLWRFTMALIIAGACYALFALVFGARLSLLPGALPWNF